MLRARPAPDGGNPVQARPSGGEGIAAVGEAKANPFQYRPQESVAIGCMVQPDKGAADTGIIVRCALAAQIGQEQGPARRFQRAERCRELRRRAVRDAREPVQGVGRGQDHPHLMPPARHGVAECMHGAPGIRPEGIVRGEQHAGGPERGKGLALAESSHADGRCRVVAAAARHRNSRGQPEPLRQYRAEPTRDLGALHQARHLRPRQARRAQQGLRPRPPADVEPSRSSGVGHVGDMLTGKPKSDVVFWQQHLRGAGENLRLVARDPYQFRRGEAGKHDVAANCPELRIAV